MLQHLVNKGDENSRQHVADFNLFDFQQADSDGHYKQASHRRHLRNDVRQ